MEMRSVQMGSGVGHAKRVPNAKKKSIGNSSMTLTEEIRRCLRMPTFDNWQWEDEEILLLLQQMYIDLDLLRKFNIELSVLQKFLCQVYMNYNEVPFHNFQHCFTVSQMVRRPRSLCHLSIVMSSRGAAIFPCRADKSAAASIGRRADERKRRPSDDANRDSQRQYGSRPDRSRR